MTGFNLSHPIMRSVVTDHDGSHDRSYRGLIVSHHQSCNQSYDQSQKSRICAKLRTQWQIVEERGDWSCVCRFSHKSYDPIIVLSSVTGPSHDRRRLTLRINLLRNNFDLVLWILVVALLAGVHSPAEQSERRAQRLAADADGKHQPSHLMIVVVQTLSLIHI